MAFFGTLFNIIFHGFVLGISILIFKFFEVKIPLESIAVIYFLLQTIRLHFTINSFAANIVNNPDEVIKQIQDIKKRKES